MPQSLLTQRLKDALADFSAAPRYWVALSGGMDSMLLLHLMARVVDSDRLKAVHINHQLSVHADEWADLCRHYCQLLGVDIIVERVKVDTRGSLEDAARQARYGVFEKLLRDGDVMVMGHHQDDQLETMLLRLLRGSGPGALAGMSASRALGVGTLLRPWLQEPRTELQAAAAAMALSWVEDDSNRSLQFDRNYLRHEVLPKLQQRWPNMGVSWQQSASLLSASQRVVDGVAQQDRRNCQPTQEKAGFSLTLETLAKLDAFRCGNVIRACLSEVGWPLPNTGQIQSIHKLVNLPKGGELSWQQVRLRCYNGRVHVGCELQLPPEEPQLWSGHSALHWGEWQLRLVPVDQGGFRVPQEGLRVRARRPGERSQPSWRRHSQTLKKLLQEVNLPPWLRDQVPVIESAGQNQTLAVGDLWVSQGCEVETGGVRLEWAWREELRNVVTQDDNPAQGSIEDGAAFR